MNVCMSALWLRSSVVEVFSLQQAIWRHCKRKCRRFWNQCSYLNIALLLHANADLVQPAVNQLINLITDKPAPFINLIEAGLAETVVNALKYGIPANSTIFGSGFSGVPALPSAISDVLQIILSSRVKVGTLQSADTLLQDFFQVCHQTCSNGSQSHSCNQ